MMSSQPGGPGSQKQGWAERRRQKIRAEIERNRRGEYTVPTWVLALALAAMVGAWATLVILA
ncbi:hypothetical protein [Salinispora cortesiana]|uniref:hypothetical protein n=1 Tax=Salinispora cortesiana TaxID=1305843 RepID=UPI0004219A67|nr:hypothetical protein [Salinispora cortesiana]